MTLLGPLVLGVIFLTGPSAAAAPVSSPASGHAAGATDAELSALLARFAKAPGIYAKFREEKHLAMLQAPLVNEGTIHYAPPGRLARHTVRPIASSILIEGGQLQLGDADGRQTMELGTNPVARLFVDSFMLLLAGDRAGLERYFAMRFTPAPRQTAMAARPAAASVEAAPSSVGWRLALLPRVSPMNKVLTEIALRGDGLAIHEMEVRETNGDWTRTVFSDVDVNHRYTSAEAARVFRMPKK